MTDQAAFHPPDVTKCGSSAGFAVQNVACRQGFLCKMLLICARVCEGPARCRKDSRSGKMMSTDACPTSQRGFAFDDGGKDAIIEVQVTTKGGTDRV